MPFLRRLAKAGYECHIFYLWLPSADLAVARVRRRVETGGHDVAEAVIRRRFRKSLVNFYHLYRPAAATWRLYDGTVVGVVEDTMSGMGTLILAGIAVGTLGGYATARLMTAWLYSVSPHDPATYVVSVLILVSVALIAALGPVQGAMRASPVDVLTE